MTNIFLYILISLVTAPFVRHRGRQGSPVPKAVLPGGERVVPRCRTKSRSERALNGVEEMVSFLGKMEKIVTNRIAGQERKSYKGM